MDKLDAEFKFGQEALNLRAYRQQVLSANIANADTPGYKARDIDFAATLKTALANGGHDEAGGGGGLMLATAQAGHLSGTPAPSALDDTYHALKYRTPAQSSLDNNTVDLDTERVNFADNALHYEAGLTAMTQQIKAMLAALS